MGANFETLTLTGALTHKEVTDAFDKAQDQDRYENGHSYSGGFGMATGLTFEDRTFPNQDAAYDFLDSTCKKWENAIAVKFENDGETSWLIGACCAS